MVAPSRSWGDRIGASGGNRGRPGAGGGFNRGAQRLENWQGNPVAPNKFERPASKNTGKQGQSGSKGNVNTNQMAGNVYGKPYGDLTDVEKAVIESRRQRKQQGWGLDIAQTIMGAMPAPVSGPFALGRMMGQAAEDEAMANPGRFTTIPGQPGGIKSTSGPLTSNRALPGNAAKTTEASTDESAKKKKFKTALPTLLGAPASPLGTANNPMMIT
jgi:hypothetical protein